MEKLQVMDLFAGAGGLSNGFEQTNKFKVKIAVEINENARKTYELNHQDVILHKDITVLKYFNEDGKLDKEFSDIDVIIGGPPCQGFSNANRQKNTLISSNNQLVKEYLRAIEAIRPKAFVMENVRTMESEKHKFYLNNEDEEVLVELKIEANDEHIKIGNSTSYSESLRTFLMKAYESAIDLTPYMMNKDIFSKLNTLLKHAKKQSNSDLIDYLNKETNKKYFMQLVNQNWQEAHKEYWDNIYQLDWVDFGENLKKAIGNNNFNTKQFTGLLGDIIDSQKVIKKVSELINNEIKLYGLEISNNDLEIHIKSFNVFNFIKCKLASLGYVFNDDNYIFNAAQYGVPQERRRLILMGVLKDSLKTEIISTPEPMFSKENFNTIYDAIGDLEGIDPKTNVIEDVIEREANNLIIGSPLNEYLNNNHNNTVYNHVRTESREVALKRFKSLREGQNFHDLDESLKSTYSDHRRTQNTIYKRLSYSKPSDTVLNARKSMWIHPVIDRAISIREAARLQSFQDSYKFSGSKDSQYQQIGNAVPPLLARSVAESLLESLGFDVDEKIKSIIRPLEENQGSCLNLELANKI